MSLICAISKSSFERFGDDLIELLLSYIAFEDCFHYKCVSKQWKRLVFNKQNKLTICMRSKISFFLQLNDELNLRSIEQILDNCANIKSLEIRRDLVLQVNLNKLFELIIKKCNYLSEIEFYSVDYLDMSTIEIFFTKFGANLKTILLFLHIDVSDVNWLKYQTILRLCTNVTKLSFNRELKNIIRCDTDDMIFEKLKSFTLWYGANDDKSLLSLLFKPNNNAYSCFECIKFIVKPDVTENGLNILFKSLANHMTYLKRLSIRVDYIINKKIPLVLLLEEFGGNCHNKCKYLKEFELVLGESTLITTKLLDSINGLINLKRLSLELRAIDDRFKPFLMSESLNKLTNLAHLKVKSIKNFDRFFQSIDDYLPKLQTIRCYINKDKSDITEETFHSLSKLTNLQTIYLRFYSSSLPFDVSVIDNFKDNNKSRKLKSIKLVTN